MNSGPLSIKPAKKKSEFVSWTFLFDIILWVLNLDIVKSEDLIASFGMNYHFKSISRGVIDTRDVLYFLSITILFLSITVYKLKSFKD